MCVVLYTVNLYICDFTTCSTFYCFMTQLLVHPCVCVCVCVCRYVRTYIRTYALCMYIHTYIYTYIRMYVCIYVYVYQQHLLSIYTSSKYDPFFAFGMAAVLVNITVCGQTIQFQDWCYENTYTRKIIRKLFYSFHNNLLDCNPLFTHF